MVFKERESPNRESFELDTRERNEIIKKLAFWFKQNKEEHEEKYINKEKGEWGENAVKIAGDNLASSIRVEQKFLNGIWDREVELTIKYFFRRERDSENMIIKHISVNRAEQEIAILKAQRNRKKFFSEMEKIKLSPEEIAEIVQEGEISEVKISSGKDIKTVGKGEEKENSEK